MNPPNTALDAAAHATVNLPDALCIFNIANGINLTEMDVPDSLQQHKLLEKSVTLTVDDALEAHHINVSLDIQGNTYQDNQSCYLPRFPPHRSVN